MTDDLLDRLRAADAAPAERVGAELRTLGDLPARIAAEPVVVPFRRRRHVRRAAVGIAAAIVAIALIVPLAVLRPLGRSGDTRGGTGPGPSPDDARWITVATLDELGAHGIMFVPTLHAFVIGGEPGPYALNAIPYGQEQRVLFCRDSGTFQGPGDARYEIDGSGSPDLDRIPTRTTGDGTIEIAPSLPPVASTIHVNPSTRDPSCHTVLGFPFEGEPGFAIPPNARLGAIAVALPQQRATVSSPVRVLGSADVFEATVSIRILDEQGNVLAETFATATCGTGCRGTFDTEVPFSVDREQPGTVQVFEASAKDGSMINVVEIPVTLRPAG